MINLTLIRREFASILSHYSPDRLAQKVFASTTFLKRLLTKFRQLRAQMDPNASTAIQNMLDAQVETTRVRADYATLHEFYWGEARRLQEQLDAAHHRRQSDLRGVLAGHDLETPVFREGVGKLRSQVENLRHLGRTRSGSRCLNVPKLMNFLNRDQTRVNDNWKRLQTVDDPFAQGSPFATLAEDDSDEEEKDQNGDQDDGAQGKNAQGGKDNEVDLTHQDSDTSEPSSRKTTPTKKKGSRGSSRKVPDRPQLRPSGWAPSADEARSPSNQLMFLESDVRESIKNEPVGVRPGYWPDLVDADVRVAQAVMDDASSEHDGVRRDANYNPDDDVDIQDDDDVPGGDNVPSAPKRRRTSRSSHSDAPVTQSSAATDTPPKRMCYGSLRRQSPLAQVDSGSLTVADTEVVVVPGPGISSWCHYGILMTFAPSSAHVVHQSAGFPDYATNKAGGIQTL
ncbi:hypothetical protein PHMEG_0006055 [Phytophthora megakarya]|uniref:Uncharacterized protein n=1 Tax=Phytophthora megakarya TaxID=4795 RepID=A0A225WRS3_9STRA|nr:hypothetical protein PHMEG_0006055 [Phytophthora megakarya]